MIANQNRFTQSRNALALLATLAMLQACGGTPTTETPTTVPAEQTPAEPIDTGVSVALPPSAYQADFTIADNALISGDWMTASVALAPLQDADAGSNPDDSDYLQYMLARIDYRRGEQRSALSRLTALDRPDQHPGIAYRVLNFKRHLLALENRHIESAKLGARVMALAPEADQAGIKRSIWLDLNRCTAAQLETERSKANDDVWQGWLALAAIDNSNALALAAELVNWQGEFPQHPAANPLPGGLEFLLQPAPPPGKVALLLPLSGRLGPAGRAVRDGYLASYYRARAAGEAPTSIQVIDSDRYTSATEAYNDAVLQGAELIVGPLSKGAVTDLATQTQRSVPVIALNRIDQATAPAPSALVQLSLSPEDEAKQLASRAFGNGARTALVLRPAGAWGDKIQSAFEQRWRALGGTVVQSVAYTGKDDYSASVKAGLGIAASEDRRRKVRDMLASNVEFTPRRRHDVDAILMLSRTPVEARAIKPLLAFHYAGALPVYATSSIHGGRQDNRDRDLDGTRVTEMPWLLGADPGLLKSLSASNSHQYTRLNALGVDAYHLQSRIQQLQAGPDALVSGSTGLLTMNPKLQIERELPMAIFDGDRLRPL